jgi:hypothetical protein
MINNISWASYWTALTILLCLYYAGVLALFYLPEIRQLFSARRKLSPVGLSTGQDFDGHASEEETAELPVEVQSFASEMAAFLDQAKYAGTIKDEILFGTQQILKKYPTLKGSNYQEGINKLLEFEAKSKCAVHLSQEELRQVWLS